MLKLVNEARREAGLTAAVYSSDPVSQATVNARAKELRTKYSHNRPNGGTITDLRIEMSCTERFTEENIAMVGFNYMEVDGGLYTPNKPETEALYFFNLWMSDVNHKSTILAPFTKPPSWFVDFMSEREIFMSYSGLQSKATNLSETALPTIFDIVPTAALPLNMTN